MTEASGNFDLEDLPTLLARVGENVKGFGNEQRSFVETRISAMEVDEAVRFDLAVEFNGTPVDLRIEVFMDDYQAPDVYFYTSSDLAETVDAIIGAVQKEAEDRLE